MQRNSSNERSVPAPKFEDLAPGEIVTQERWARTQTTMSTRAFMLCDLMELHFPRLSLT